MVIEALMAPERLWSCGHRKPRGEMLSIVRSVDLPGGLPHPSRGALKEPTGGQGVPRQGLYGVSCLGCAPNLSPLHLHARSPHCSRLRGEPEGFIFGNRPLLFRLFYPRHAPSLEGQLGPLITGDRNSSNTHFGTEKRAGGEGINP